MASHGNHLEHESSPYLLMHAHNPVDWYPWGEEAFARARREDKPIFLSVGYATCYWCHVMERESFANEDVAAILNRSFVCVKVDREERPDVDELYMTAVQALTGQGGWPMSVWLTPDLKPFYAGTYFPPFDRGGRPGLTTITQRINELWRDDRAALLDQAERLSRAVAQWCAGDGPSSATVGRTEVSEAIEKILAREDKTHGGPPGAPKFPPDLVCALLLTVWRDTGDERLLAYVTRALAGMAMGGIFDHLGGGFHRYSVDAAWTVPHFEKMLYNQALLLRPYAELAELTGEPRWRRVAEAIVAFVDRDLTNPESGAFYSALDAETGAEEGRTYVWTREEVAGALGEDYHLFASVYGLNGPPNFEHDRYVLRLARPLAETAASLGVTEEALEARLAPLRRRLEAVRDQREQPRCDDKVLTAWNALMIGALADAGRRLNLPAWIERAARAADFLLANLRTPDGELLRVYRVGVAKQPGFLEDYAFLAEALLDLHEATGDERWLTAADELAEHMIRLFWDEELGAFYAVRDSQPDLFVRLRSLNDGAVPAGGSVAAEVLGRLAKVRGAPALAAQARRAIGALAPLVTQSPSGFAYLLRAAWRLDPPARPMDSAAHVKLTIEPRSDGVAAVLIVDEGWHINAHRPGQDWLVPTQIVVEPTNGGQAATIDYPPGQPLGDGADASEVYTGRTVVPIRLPAGAKGVVVVRARVQACGEGVCLAPAELRAELAQP